MAARVTLTAEQKAMVRDAAFSQLRSDPAHPIDALCNEHGCQMSVMDGRNEMLERRNEILEEALRSISTWAESYPFEVFPEPDFGKAATLLLAGGITMDIVAASCMRRVVQGVGKIAQEALDAK